MQITNDEIRLLFRPGVYRHYKGQYYLAKFLSRDDATERLCVVYDPLYETPDGFGRTTHRDAEEFLGAINIPIEPGLEQVRPRFEFVSDWKP